MRSDFPLKIKNNEKYFGEMKNGVLPRTGAYILFSFEPLGGFNPPMAQTKGLAFW